MFVFYAERKAKQATIVIETFPVLEQFVLQTSEWQGELQVNFRRRQSSSFEIARFRRLDEIICDIFKP